ncbi:hypothetical protein LSAT2_004618 [Lamellibrachia satsuma]|nr:hypothetical protein LSAT2_004618 [Lamellibrachia satsuma]
MVQVYIRIDIEKMWKYVIERKWKYVYKHQSVKRTSFNIVFVMGTFIALLTCILFTPCRTLTTDVPTRQHWLDSTRVPTTMSTTKGDNNGMTTSMCTDVPLLSDDNTTLAEVAADSESELTMSVNRSETRTCENVTANIIEGHISWVKSIRYVSYVSLTILVGIGICGNIFTIRVMLAKNFQRMTVSTFLVTLVVSDTVFIVVSIFNKSSVRSFIGTDFRSIDLTSCRVFFWAFRTSKLVSSCIVVFICIERFIAVCFPLRSKTVCTKRMAYASIVGTLFGASAYCGFRTWLDTSVVQGTCLPNSTHLKGNIAIVEISLLLSITAYAIVPAIIMVVLNSVTVTCLWRSRRKVHAQISVHDPAGKAATQLVRTTAMLLSTNAAFIVFLTPISLAHVVSFFRRQDFYESSDPIFAVCRELTQIFEQLNYSVNFFLYVVCNKRFRSEFKRTVLCRNTAQV